MEYSPLVFSIFIGFLGLILGSFSSLLIHRLHFDKPGIWNGRSQCPACQKKLEWKNLFPVLSWLFQKGKCTFCKKQISAIYPLMELFFGLTFYTFAQRFYSTETIQLIILLFLIFFILVLFFYDLQYLEVDMRIIIPAIIIAIFWITLEEISLENAALGGLVGFLFYAGQYGLSLIIKKPLVGDGDMYLGLFMGLLLGWQKTLGALFVAYILGSIIAIPLLLMGKAKRDTPIPMGAFLMPALLIMLYMGDQIIEKYFLFLGF